MCSIYILCMLCLGACAVLCLRIVSWVYKNDEIRSSLSSLFSKFRILRNFRFTNVSTMPATFNQSVTDSECLKAAQDVEQLETELDELARELARYDSSQASTVVEPAKPLRTEDFDSLTAWLNSFTESLPCSNSSLPDSFSNLLDKPLQLHDENTMTSESFRAALGLPTISIGSSSSASSIQPITISSTQEDSQVLAPSSQTTSISSASFTTPTRSPPTASTQAPKADRKPYTRKTGVRQYSRWSMGRLGRRIPGSLQTTQPEAHSGPSIYD